MDILQSKTNSSHLLNPHGGTQLLVRHFPRWLSEEEKESLLSHFGATEVIVLPPRGKMRNCAFAAFATLEDANRAMSKLHQLDLFGSRLIVEFASPRHSTTLAEAQTDKCKCNTSSLPPDDIKEPEDKPCPPVSRPASQDAPSPPSLCYLFPPPTPTTLDNIANALACVPKFYVQVLHLMNKMNLPPPFGPPTPRPPLPPDTTPIHPPLHHPSSPCSPSSGEEEGSEIESDEDARRKLTTRLSEPRRVVKRRAVTFQQVKDLIPATKRPRETSKTEQQTNLPKRIEIHVPAEITPSSMLQPAHKITSIEQKQPVLLTSSNQSSMYAQGWKLPTMESSPLMSTLSVNVETTPTTVAVNKSSSAKEMTVEDLKQQENNAGVMEGGEDENGGEKRVFISLAELKAHSLTEEERREEHVFNNYSMGEPSLRLYIKNLSKQSTEEDLHYIFGRYINWTSEDDKNMFLYTQLLLHTVQQVTEAGFDIRLMQSGRMKGQAFVGMPSEPAAMRAVQETNGYLLHGKPMVVQFARTTKPKGKDK